MERSRRATNAEADPMMETVGPGCDSRPLILLNACHSSAGGGFVYLQNIVRELSVYEEFRWLLLAPEQTLKQMTVSPRWTTRVSPKLSGIGLHAWEQFVLPFWARSQGVAVILCNANYVPVLAPNPVPIIHTAVMEGLAHAKTRRTRLYWRALKLWTSISIRRSAGILVTAQHLADDYPAGQALRRRGRVGWAPPGAPPRLVNTGERDPDLILAVGDIYSHKEYRILVQAMANLIQIRPGSKLEIIGRPLDTLVTDELTKLVKELELRAAVKLCGGRPHPETLKRISEASCLVSASLAETSNMVVVEAMALGTPVVLADLKFQRRLAGDAALYVPLGDNATSAYCNALFTVLAGGSLPQAMSQAGHNRAQFFSWNKTASAIVTAMQKTLGCEE